LAARVVIGPRQGRSKHYKYQNDTGNDDGGFLWHRYGNLLWRWRDSRDRKLKPEPDNPLLGADRAQKSHTCACFNYGCLLNAGAIVILVIIIGSLLICRVTP